MSDSETIDIGYDCFYFGYINHIYPEEFVFYDTFDSPINDDMLEIIKDKGCRNLHFGKNFNQNLDNLSDFIESIRLWECLYFNQPLDNLPVNLNKLVVGDSFKKPLDFLPFGLKHLELPVGYNQPLDNLPSGLEYLKIDWCYDKPLNNLPEGLKILKIFTGLYKYDLLNLPHSLEKLIIPSSYKGKIKEGVDVEYY